MKPDTISESYSSYALDLVTRICTQVGPGLPGSPQERERAAIIHEELENHLGAGNVSVEEFRFAPAAFLSVYPLSAVLMLSAAGLNLSLGRVPAIPAWVTAAAALACTLLACGLYYVEFVLSKELLDPLFKQKQSVNVIGVLRPPGTQPVQRLLLVSGHHDSAPENTWLGCLGYGFFLLMATWFFGLGTLFVMNLFQFAGAVAGNVELARLGTLGWVLLAYPLTPAVFFALSFTRGWQNGGNVPGAADNLSACALAVALCRYLVENPASIPADTEIRFCSFGSEEAGLRGARRYVASHLAEMNRLEARLLNFETIAHAELVILSSDINGTVKNAPGMVKSVIAAAQRAGVPFQVKPATLGVAGDAGPFSRAGLQAVTVLGFQVPQQLVAFYHQKRDGPEILTREPLENALKLALEWIHNCGQTTEQAPPEVLAVEPILEVSQ